MGMRFEESAPVRVVVIGGGVGGTLVANLLARALRSRGAVKLVTASPWHVYEPALLYVPFDDLQQVDVQRPEVELIDEEVALIEDPAAGIDTAARSVTLASGLVLRWDYLVLATGSVPDFASVPGLAEHAYHFTTLAAAEKLRETLVRFAGGRVVVATTGLPYKHPAAPLEFTFLLADFLERNGLAGRTQIRYVHPDERIGPADVLDALARARFEERGVRTEMSFIATRVDPDHILGQGGRDVPYDLLVAVPAHRGVEVVRRTGLSDGHGCLPVDPGTLRVRGTHDVFAIGDCSDLAVAKVPSAAHHQAHVVCELIVSDFEGRTPRRRNSSYDGRMELFVGVGDGRAVLIEGDYDRRPVLHGPSQALDAARSAFDRTYWNLVPTGLA